MYPSCIFLCTFGFYSVAALIEDLQSLSPVLIYSNASEGKELYSRFKQHLDDLILSSRIKRSWRAKLYNGISKYIGDYRLIPQFELHPHTEDPRSTKIEYGKLLYLFELLGLLQLLLHTKTNCNGKPCLRHYLVASWNCIFVVRILCCIYLVLVVELIVS